MKIAVSLNMLAQAGRSDVAVYKEHLELATSPNHSASTRFSRSSTTSPVTRCRRRRCMLGYFAGRTKRVALGTAVIVLPWHDPIRVAESIALVDVLCGGRRLFGFGRGAAAGVCRLSHPDGGSTPALHRSGTVIRLALSEPGSNGRANITRFRAPRSARGRSRFRAPVLCLRGHAGVSRDYGEIRLRHDGHHAERMAEGGGRYRRFREIAAAVGHAPLPPLILTNVSCAETHDEAHERAMRYLGRKWDLIDNHYRFSDGDLATVKGYEVYGR